MELSKSPVLEWFAIRVKSNREQVTSMSLTGKGYDVFLPELRRFRPRGKSPDKTPLFPGYVFCKFDVTQRLPILMLPGVVHIVGFGKTPVPVNEEELESLRVLVEAGLPINTEEPYTLGQSVRIQQGPLAGAEGILVGLQDQRFVVSITLLQRSVSVVLQRDWIISARPRLNREDGNARYDQPAWPA